MARVASLYDISGVVGDIIPPNKAIISFSHQAKLVSALLTNTQFYYEGKHIPANRTLADYLRAGVTVKFSCQESVNKKKDSPCPWVVTVCWIVDKNPLNSSTVMRGLDDVPGRVIKLGGRHGIISVFEGTKHRHNVLFLASKLYIDGKRFPAGKSLGVELHVNEVVHVDAIPCLPEENDEHCSWFATCVFKGQRPKIVHDNHDNGHKTLKREYDCGQQTEKASDFKNQYLELMSSCIHTPHSVYVVGRGMIMKIMDEEFGIIMGQFKKNVFQTIFFHRKHFFLFGSSLVNDDIRALLNEEDRVRFVAVGAPPGFATDWIAVQVSIQKEPLKEYQH